MLYFVLSVYYQKQLNFFHLYHIFDIDNMSEYIKLSAINVATLILGKQLMVSFSLLVFCCKPSLLTVLLKPRKKLNILLRSCNFFQVSYNAKTNVFIKHNI